MKIILNMRINKKPAVFGFNRRSSNFHMVVGATLGTNGMFIDIFNPIFPKCARPQFLHFIYFGNSVIALALKGVIRCLSLTFFKLCESATATLMLPESGGYFESAV